ncbi:hypothetical protein EVJ58_g4529 [Rhodofomes roseus]|uniref:DUF6534 domain-containing protein n=1 Tax=Rhodofomes roseus TaxID=34475 RepID=A0A4Y9YHF0_9APHY|nr:hypothetical protein EVJ58_g4529 [Rhodofomes roseus]
MKYQRKFDSVFNSVHHHRATIGCSLAANIACDLVIAAANVYYLEIRRTLSQRTNKAIKLLIVYSLNTYALATVFTLWLACPGLVHAALEFILVRLYPCSLLSLLNSRESIRRALVGRTDTRMSFDVSSIASQDTLFVEDIDNAMNPTGRLRAMIGYHLAYDNNLIGMVMTQGRQRDVINVGIGIKQLAVSPPDISVNVYAESFYHKLTPLEMTFVKPEEGDEVVLRRLCLLLALKQAYIKAIGQPMGFDWARLEFNIPNNSVTGDNIPLLGWEFRVWTSDIGGSRGEVNVEEKYQCAIAFFRGTPHTRFIWQKERKDIESWVQFINLDQLINVVPKLMD